jgi:hypothetical protein
MPRSLKTRPPRPGAFPQLEIRNFVDQQPSPRQWPAPLTPPSSFAKPLDRGNKSTRPSRELPNFRLRQSTQAIHRKQHPTRSPDATFRHTAFRVAKPAAVHRTEFIPFPEKSRRNGINFVLYSTRPEMRPFSPPEKRITTGRARYTIDFAVLLGVAAALPRRRGRRMIGVLSAGQPSRLSTPHVGQASTRRTGVSPVPV